jgi:thioesterase DpgC
LGGAPTGRAAGDRRRRGADGRARGQPPPGARAPGGRGSAPGDPPQAGWRLGLSRRSAPEALRAETVYQELTDHHRREIRVEELVFEAAEAYPGLLPTREQIAEERTKKQADKAGLELAQGAFLSQLLASPRAGTHLVHAMLRPRREARERLAEFKSSGRADLGLVTVERIGNAGHVNLRNLRFLNAEDDAATAALEIGVDLVLLDPACEVGVLRGAPVDHPRYAGRRVFNAGLNLTHLYHGQISFVNFMIARELGLVAKIHRGHWLNDDWESGLEDFEEKPWLAAVESFAIGGGCQLLLVMDRVIAEEGAYFNLPARKEGIIPGSANLRLPRLVGDRMTRQGIFFNRTFHADSSEGRLIADEVVPASGIEAAVERSAREITSAGLTSLVANRRMLRLGQEPLDTHRMYMAWYAREQAYCQYSEALIANLENNWDARSRRLHD